MRTPVLVLAVVLLAELAAALPAAAQRYPFERALDVGAAPVIDVSTIRGKISIRVGDPGRVVVAGTVTVRIGWDVPANAVELAQKISEHPPIEKNGNTVRLRPPSDVAESRAVTVAYDVRVPRDAHVQVVSDSGAIDVRDVGGPVQARTQSSTIALADLGATVDVETGSGEVTLDGAGGAVRITTSSSAITARGLREGLRARTGSGRVIGSFNGRGAVDVRTKSSGIDLKGVNGALTTSTESGRTIVTGVPSEPWDVSTGSSSIDVGFDSAVNATLQASTGSGSVSTSGLAVGGSIEKRRVAGPIGSGGPAVRLSSRSGSIKIQGHSIR